MVACRSFIGEASCFECLLTGVACEEFEAVARVPVNEFYRHHRFYEDSLIAIANSGGVYVPGRWISGGDLSPHPSMPDLIDIDVE